MYLDLLALMLERNSCKVVSTRLVKLVIILETVTAVPHRIKKITSVPSFNLNLLVPSRDFNSSVKSFITSKILNQRPIKSLNAFITNNRPHALDAIKYCLNKKDRHLYSLRRTVPEHIKNSTQHTLLTDPRKVLSRLCRSSVKF